MQNQIRKALESIVQTFQFDNLQYLQHLRQALQNIVAVLNQQQQAMKQYHQNELNRLKNIIVQKQIEIQRLKSSKDQAQKVRTINNITPCRILLKNNTKNSLNIANSSSRQNKQNQQNQVKQQLNQIDDAFSNICISNMKKNRLSLQIVPNNIYGCSGNQKKLNRVSSNIKNKIINQKSKSKSNLKQNGNITLRSEVLKNTLSPRGFTQQNCQLSQTTYTTYTSNYLNTKTENLCYDRKIEGVQYIKSPRRKAVNAYNSKREQFLKVAQCSQGKYSCEENKRSQIKSKTRLCRKPSNKGKRQLVQKKRLVSNQSNGNITHRAKCCDVTIPIKIISMADMKPR